MSYSNIKLDFRLSLKHSLKNTKTKNTISSNFLSPVLDTQFVFVEMEVDLINSIKFVKTRGFLELSCQDLFKYGVKF
jgi:hypothetical protein